MGGREPRGAAARRSIACSRATWLLPPRCAPGLSRVSSGSRAALRAGCSYTELLRSRCGTGSGTEPRAHPASCRTAARGSRRSGPSGPGRVVPSRAGQPPPPPAPSAPRPGPSAARGRALRVPASAEPGRAGPGQASRAPQVRQDGALRAQSPSAGKAPSVLRQTRRGSPPVSPRLNKYLRALAGCAEL